MRAGELRHRLQIQEVSEAQNTFGEPEKLWATIATVWGRVHPILGRERFTAQQVQADVTHEITIRDRTDVAPVNRIRFGDRYFNIHEVRRPAERNISLVIMAKEVVA